MPYVTAKIDRMRKPQDFRVSPMSDGRVMVQSAKSIGTFDFRTREGVLNTRGCYFPHLHPALGARPYVFPADFVRACLDACPALDSVTQYHGGAIIVENTVRVF